MNAPNKGPGSGYVFLFCLGDALKNNALSVALDAVGLIPEAEGFTKVYENMAGYQIARSAAIPLGYRGIVATQQGAKAVAQGKGAIGLLNGALGLGDTSCWQNVDCGAMAMWPALESEKQCRSDGLQAIAAVITLSVGDHPYKHAAQQEEVDCTV